MWHATSKLFFYLKLWHRLLYKCKVSFVKNLTVQKEASFLLLLLTEHSNKILIKWNNYENKDQSQSILTFMISITKNSEFKIL